MAYIHTPHFPRVAGRSEHPTMNLRWMPAPFSPASDSLEQEWEIVETYPGGGSRVIERVWRPVPVVTP